MGHDNRNKGKFSGGKAYKAIFQLTPGFKRKICQLLVLNRGDPNFYTCGSQCSTVTHTCLVSGQGLLLKGKKWKRNAIEEYHRTISAWASPTVLTLERREPAEGQMAKQTSSTFVTWWEAMKRREEGLLMNPLFLHPVLNKFLLKPSSQLSMKGIWEFSQKSQANGPLAEKWGDGKSKRIGQKTLKGNQMTALRFQTGWWKRTNRQNGSCRAHTERNESPYITLLFPRYFCTGKCLRFCAVGEQAVREWEIRFLRWEWDLGLVPGTVLMCKCSGQFSQWWPACRKFWNTPCSPSRSHSQ